MLTVFELAFRSMRQNVKHYYLYFFALIFSMSLFFIVASLQHDQMIQIMTESSVRFFAAFQLAAVLIIVIVGIFAVSANHIFLRRRSREIGLYQLIGLSKGWIVRYLMIENVLLGLGALFAGIICGALVSRLFVLILMNLLGLEGVPAINFSVLAAFKTAMVFLFILVLTSVQMIVAIYRNTLLNLFQADKQPDLSNRPPTVLTAIYALLGPVLIGYGYKLSGQMANIASMTNDELVLNALLVLVSTITGTYISFRVTIRWCFAWFRKRKNGHLSLLDSLSLAPLMHRMKANASSLTLITILSALTITLVTMAYSVYFSVERDTRIAMPYDFLFENKQQHAQSFKSELESHRIRFSHKTVQAVRTMGVIRNPLNESSNVEESLLWLPAEQLEKTGANLTTPPYGEAIAYDASATLNGDHDVLKRYPTVVELKPDGQIDRYPLKGLVVENLMNFNVSGSQLLVSEATLKEIEDRMVNTLDFETVHLDTYRISDKKELAVAASLYAKYRPDNYSVYDFYTRYKEALQIAGLLIFISAFLGLAFLVSTGSILYFKQMTEAEQEKQSFKTLRQLGFDVKMIMKGIVRKQAIVFLLPLSISVLHSVFAVKAASFMVISDITFPAIVSMGAYAIIYFAFAIFTLGYYRKIVKTAML